MSFTISFEDLNKIYKLDHGCIMTFGEISKAKERMEKKAEKRAFIMKNCKISENNETNSPDEAVLEFQEYLDLDKDFIKDVKDAIKLKNSKKFKEIIEKFG